MSSNQTGFWWPQTIWAPYTILGGKGIQVLKLIRTELALTDKAEVLRYQDIMSVKFSEANLEDMDPAKIIHLSKLSYDAVQEAQPDKKNQPGFRSPYKYG